MLQYWDIVTADNLYMLLSISATVEDLEWLFTFWHFLVPYKDVKLFFFQKWWMDINQSV